MRELSINEVDAVSGGHWLVKAIVGGIITEIIVRSAEAAADIAADLPTDGPSQPGGACKLSCHGG